MRTKKSANKQLRLCKSLMNKTLLALCTLAILAGCNSSAPPPTPAAYGPRIKALPFTIETVMLSDLFKDELKVGKVNVNVQGGNQEEWVATALAVAYEVGKLGANSVEATVDRSDLEGIEAAPLYLHLAKVYYSPDPKRTVWTDQAQIMIAVTERPATREEVERDTEFWALIEKLNGKGMDSESAENKAGATIAKKFHLPKDWQLYSGGLADNKYPGTNFNVDSSAATNSLATLDTCMRGKIIRLLEPC
jgi:Prokaryotic membrane lipoprotein lipid attachment site